MSTLIARHPLQTIPMSAAQRGPRRLSARLQEKDEAQPVADSSGTAEKYISNVSNSLAATNENGPASKKRKIDYDEEDDGFSFSRVKKGNLRASTSKTLIVSDAIEPVAPAVYVSPRKAPLKEVDESAGPIKKRRNKMSFSTPGRRIEEPVRRSKRLSSEQEELGANSKPSRTPKEQTHNNNSKVEDRTKRSELPKNPSKQAKIPAPIIVEASVSDHNGTKISLPFADTPVIRRNKAMRQGKSEKGERRSSLGLRGRRASSLIESGNSNALPHQEVGIADFYKHIESEGLPEPRRMRQLLTWCATRALGEKSTGGEFEDQSARMAARVIQEELLNDLMNQSEMSDWFNREDIPVLSRPLPTRPNPKNEQNAEKIKELEEQIKILRTDRDSLETLGRPPSTPNPQEISPSTDATIVNVQLLSAEDARLLASLRTYSNTSSAIQDRLNTITSSLQPVVDSFADGVHMIGQYRDAADKIAGRALSICAERLAEKEKLNRPNTVQTEHPSPGTQLGSVLRSLSRVER